jgi:hypothetical protein
MTRPSLASRPGHSFDPVHNFIIIIIFVIVINFVINFIVFKVITFSPIARRRVVTATSLFDWRRDAFMVRFTKARPSGVSKATELLAEESESARHLGAIDDLVHTRRPKSASLLKLLFLEDAIVIRGRNGLRLVIIAVVISVAGAGGDYWRLEDAQYDIVRRSPTV